MRTIIFLMIFTLVSCESEIDPCSPEIINAKGSLENSFNAINTQNPRLSDFYLELKSYLANYKDKKCIIDGNEFHPHKEIIALSTEIETFQNTISNKVVYGDDDRVDVVNHPDLEVRNYANSVAAMISKSRIASNGNLTGQTLGMQNNLCSTERFRDQKAIASCTGFLVDDDLLLTAGHCVKSGGKCDSTSRWVFGFSGLSYKVNPDDIYKCSAVESFKLDSSSGLDYALVRLDRKVAGRKALQFRLNGKISNDSNLVVLGHPSGLPLKIADNAQVRTNSKSSYFVANLDTFGGNSGSPVIDLNTGVVEGILVRGEQDYQTTTNPSGDGLCRETYKCSDDDCGGEESTRVTSVAGLDHYKLKGSTADFKNIFLSNTSLLSHFPLRVTAKKGFSYHLAGRKFLGTCISHIVERDTNQWINSSSFKCSIENFKNIYQSYVDLGDGR
jgi:hypothetical protein